MEGEGEEGRGLRAADGGGAADSSASGAPPHLPYVIFGSSSQVARRRLSTAVRVLAVADDEDFEDEEDSGSGSGGASASSLSPSEDASALRSGIPPLIRRGRSNRSHGRVDWHVLSSPAGASASARGERGNRNGVPACSQLSRAENTDNPPPHLSNECWDTRVKRMRKAVSSSFLNRIVMNYLVGEGYKDAAEHFQSESGTDPAVDLQTVEGRLTIRSAIIDGSTMKAIEMVQELDPTLFDRNPSLHFELRRQHLLDLVREEKAEEALDYASLELAPLVQADGSLRESLEEALLLLVLPNAKHSTSMGMAQRHQTAGRLNAAIMAGQCVQGYKEPRLQTMLRWLVWTQRLLREHSPDVPILSGILAERHDG
jgi:hypothetical protein